MKPSKTRTVRPDHADLDKVFDIVVKLVRATIESGKTVAMFDAGPLFTAAKFSKMTRDRFFVDLADVLTGSAFTKEMGEWATCEYEGNTRVLFRLGLPGEKLAVNDPERNFFYNMEIRDKPKKTQIISVEIPADADPKAAAELMKELYDNHQQ